MLGGDRTSHCEGQLSKAARWLGGLSDDASDLPGDIPAGSSDGRNAIGEGILVFWREGGRCLQCPACQRPPASQGSKS